MFKNFFIFLTILTYLYYIQAKIPNINEQNILQEFEKGCGNQNGIKSFKIQHNGNNYIKIYLNSNIKIEIYEGKIKKNPLIQQKNYIIYKKETNQDLYIILSWTNECISFKYLNQKQRKNLKLNKTNQLSKSLLSYQYYIKILVELELDEYKTIFVENNDTYQIKLYDKNLNLKYNDYLNLYFISKNNENFTINWPEKDKYQHSSESQSKYKYRVSFPQMSSINLKFSVGQKTEFKVYYEKETHYTLIFVVIILIILVGTACVYYKDYKKRKEIRIKLNDFH